MTWMATIPSGDMALLDVPRMRSGASWHVALIEDVHAVKAFWHDLYEAAGQHIYQHPAFHVAWLRTIGRDKRGTPLIAAVHHGGRPFMLLPFFVRRLAGVTIAVHAGEKLTNIAAPLCREAHPACVKAAHAAVCARFAEAGIDLLFMGNVRAEAKAPPVSLWPAARWIATERFFEATLPAAGLDAFMARHRGRKARQRLRRKRNRLAAAGALDVCRMTERKQAYTAIHTLLVQKAARLAQKGTVIPDGNAGWEDFYRSLFDAGILEVYTLDVDGRTLAVLAGASARGRFSVFATAFDADSPLARYSPGEVLIAHLFDALPARGVRIIDLGVGTMPYKRSWSTHSSDVGALLVPLTVRGRIAMRILAPVLAMKPAIKRAFDRHPLFRLSATRLHHALVGLFLR